MQEFIEALRKSGAKVDFIDLGKVESIEDLEAKLTEAINADGPCPIHGEGGCPDASADVTDILDSKELLSLAKTGLLGAIGRVNDADSSAAHDRLAIADVAMELYDRVLVAEERAKLDEAYAPNPDLLQRAKEDAAKLREYQDAAPEVDNPSHRERHLNGE